MHRRLHIQHDLTLVWVVLVWGINIPIMKIVMEVMPPHAMNVFRLWLATLTIGLLYCWNQKRSGHTFSEPVRSHSWRLFALGIIGFLFFQVCLVAGLNRTAAGNAALILASSPLWTAILGHTMRIDRLGSAAWLGLLSAFVGAAVIVIGGSASVDSSDATFVGNVLVLVAALCWSLYTVFSKPLVSKMDSSAVPFFGLLFALPLLTLVGWSEFGAVRWEAV